MTLNVGIANPFAYRPHVAHMAFVARQLARLGYRTFFLGCGGRLHACHSKATKIGLARRLECLKCRLGGIESYLKVRPADLDLPVPVGDAEVQLGRTLVYSSAASVLQIEHGREAEAADFQALQTKLAAPAARAYLNARHWIRANRLDSVFIFNGRLDLTRAVVEACRTEGTRFVSVERSWFGDGLQLLPEENCLGLRNMHRMTADWANKPLTYEQAARANQLMVRRLRRTSVGEWRQYNINTTAHHARDALKYLFLPSSQHEWIGHPDRASDWAHPVAGLEYLFGRLGLSMSDLVVRGHPGWSMKIKSYGANRANDFYREWARRVGAEYIDASSAVDTHQLIRRSHVVLLNGSSASMEAAWAGKPVVSFVPAPFTSSGISWNLFGPTDVDTLDATAVEALRHPQARSIDPTAQCRAALRYMYCITFRLMKFVRFTSTPDPFGFNVEDPPDLSGLESLATRGVLSVDDAGWASDPEGESRVVAAILSGAADTVRVPDSLEAPGSRAPLRRRGAYRLLDRVRKS